MGALIIVIGGVVGFFIAAVSYFSGVSLLWSLVIYAATGNAIAGWLLMRFHRDSERDRAYMRREIDAEMEALSELRAAEAAGGTTAERSPILFRALRLQEQLNNRYDSRGV